MPKVHVVIHHQTDELTIDQAELALLLGADGVFLISHDSQDSSLLPLCRQLKRRWQGRESHGRSAPLIGLNLLKSEAFRAYELALEYGADAIWVSTPGVTSAGVTPDAQRLADLLKGNNGPIVFGCVAFKYQAPEPDPKAAAIAALALGMLPTTSGAGTGLAPDVQKIRSMSLAAGGKLAVASGMTSDNVSCYVPYVSDILVSTGVSYDGHRIDPEKLVAFMAKAKNLN